LRLVAHQMRVSEGALLYRLKHSTEPSRLDGRVLQATALDGLEAVVAELQERLEDGRPRGEGRP
jgi:hypothetical protein